MTYEASLSDAQPTHSALNGNTFEPGARPNIKRQRISDWVYEELSEAIRDMSLAPGTPISEPRLASQLDVSRAPVREALTRLSDQRLVTVTPQVGTRVAPILMSEVAEACFVRSALEVSAFQTVIADPTRDTTRLRHLFEVGADAIRSGDADAFFVADEQLHQEVFALAGFPHVWDVLRGVKLNLDRLRRLLLSDALANPQIIEEHRLIVEGIEHGDESAIEAVSRHANRILTDSNALRARAPEYFKE